MNLLDFIGLNAGTNIQLGTKSVSAVSAFGDDINTDNFENILAQILADENLKLVADSDIGLEFRKVLLQSKSFQDLLSLLLHNINSEEDQAVDEKSNNDNGNNDIILLSLQNILFQMQKEFDIDENLTPPSQDLKDKNISAEIYKLLAQKKIQKEGNLKIDTTNQIEKAATLISESSEKEVGNIVKNNTEDKSLEEKVSNANLVRVSTENKSLEKEVGNIVKNNTEDKSSEKEVSNAKLVKVSTEGKNLEKEVGNANPVKVSAEDKSAKGKLLGIETETKTEIKGEGKSGESDLVLNKEFQKLNKVKGEQSFENDKNTSNGHLNKIYGDSTATAKIYNAVQNENEVEKWEFDNEVERKMGEQKTESESKDFTVDFKELGEDLKVEKKPTDFKQLTADFHHNKDKVIYEVKTQAQSQTQATQTQDIRGADLRDIRDIIFQGVRVAVDAGKGSAHIETNIFGSRTIFDISVADGKNVFVNVKTENFNLSQDFSRNFDAFKRSFEESGLLLMSFNVNTGNDFQRFIQDGRVNLGRYIGGEEFSPEGIGTDIANTVSRGLNIFV